MSVDAILEHTCGELPNPPLARWAAVFFTFFVLTLQISIAASQAFLAGAGIFYTAHLLRSRPRIAFMPIKIPLVLFCLLSLASSFAATNPTVAWFAVRKLVLFLIWLLAINLIVSARHLRRLLKGMFAVSLLTSLVAIVQFVIEYREVRTQHPGQVYHDLTSARIEGFMGHWMNFGGQQMLVFVFLATFLLLSKDGASHRENGNAGPESRISRFEFRVSPLWWAVFAFVTISIVLNFTRSVWLGCFLAGIYLVARWKSKVLWALPILLAVAYWGSPPLIRERIQHALHPTQEPALSIRLEMWGVAIKMIQAHPWLGVGPNNIEEVYDLYLPPGKSPERGYHNHLHDDFLQLGAERGLPCLASWVWLMVALGWFTWKIRQRLSAQRWIADAAFAALLAFLAEGCFEFNFGTSPVLMVFLFLTSTPFIAMHFVIADGSKKNGGDGVEPL